MSLDVAYSYCINLTEQEKLDTDKQVRKNRFELRFAIFLTVLLIIPQPSVAVFPVEGFSFSRSQISQPQQQDEMNIINISTIRGGVDHKGLLNIIGGFIKEASPMFFLVMKETKGFVSPSQVGNSPYISRPSA